MAYTTIDDPEAYFQVQLYTGNGSANHAITLGGDTDMQPDLVWIKNRDTTDSHCLFDSVRGATKEINIDLAYPNNIESTDTDTLDSFTSDGFQVDADVQVNTNAEKYVAWCWKESATSGFDIVTFTGNQTARTISHSLSAVPKFMLIKNREYGDSAHVYHVSNLATHTMEIPGTGGKNAASTIWNDTTPTSSVFSVGNNGNINKTDDSIIIYLFAPKQGFSKFGSYTGNGSTSALGGSYVHLGFSPSFLIIKSTASANWEMFDNKRIVAGYPAELHPHANAAESVPPGDRRLFFTSNGFKIDTSLTTPVNVDGQEYIYMAFAEAPFVNSNGVPCNAR